MNLRKLTNNSSLLLLVIGILLGGCQKKEETASGHPAEKTEESASEPLQEYPAPTKSEPRGAPKPMPPADEKASASKPSRPATTIPSTSPELSEFIADQLKKLTSGRILFNPPEEMRAGVKERIEARIAKGFSEDLSKGLRGAGVPRIDTIKVGAFMKVRLLGDNFDIDSLSHGEQFVAEDKFTEWNWDVTPLKSGRQELSLVATVRIKLAEWGEEKRDYPVFSQQIKVKINPIYSVKTFTLNNWQWVISTILGSGLIGWIYKRVKAKRR